MAAVPCPAKAEVIVLSDSDEDPGDKPRSGAPKHVAASSVEWVRRSTRPRKASTRFSPDDDAPPAPVRKSAAAAPSPVEKSGAEPPLRPPPGAQGRKRRRSSNSLNSNSSSCYGMELVDPQVLITYVEKLKRKIQQGRFGINMPVGPGEFVLVDAVDYLRNLGYSDFEETEEEQRDDDEGGEDDEDGQDEDDEGGGNEEGEEHETDFMDKKVFKEDIIVFEPQAAVKMEEENVYGCPNESDDKLKPEVNFWDKQVEDLMVSSSLSQNQDSSDVSYSNKSTDDSIDVEALDAATFNLLPSKVKVKFPRKRNRFNADDGLGPERRNTHNMMEQARRREMADLFSQLSSIVYSTENSKVAKIKILSGAVDMVTQLRKDQIRLSANEKSLQLINEGLLQVRDNLCKMSKAKQDVLKRNSQTNRQNKRVKNYNSL